jgi:hypothetical protein
MSTQAQTHIVPQTLSGTVTGQPFHMSAQGTPLQVFALQVGGNPVIVIEPDSLTRQPGQHVEVTGFAATAAYNDPEGVPLSDRLLWSYLLPQPMPDQDTLDAIAEDYATVSKNWPWG